MNESPAARSKLHSFRMVFVVAAVSTAVLLQAGCSLEGSEEGPPPEEPLFAPGEYGGEPLPGTEHLFNVRPSPDGSRIALIRERTPGEPSDPKNQLWITERDGSDPELVGVNILGADWSPDGRRLALTVAIGINFYVCTLNLVTGDTTQWTGGEDQFFSKPTASNPKWFRDGGRLLVSVFAKAYQQPFERGIYTIDTETGEVKGPLVEIMEATRLGNEDEYAVGQKYTNRSDPRSGNYAKYILASDKWKWITDFPQDSLDYVQVPAPNPVEDQLAQSRKVENAWQLYLMNSDGEDVHRVTDLGGDNPN